MKVNIIVDKMWDMWTMAIKLYSLQALADLMGVSYSKVRHVIYTLNKEGKPLEWEGYRFIKQGSAKHYFAVPLDVDVEYVDKPEEES